MTKFKKGDRVKVITLYDDDVDHGIELGDTATVLEDNSDLMFVRMDKYGRWLHDANGRCEKGHGAVMEEVQIALIDSETPDPTPEVPEYTMEELTKKLGHEFKIKK